MSFSNTNLQLTLFYSRKLSKFITDTATVVGYRRPNSKQYSIVMGRLDDADLVFNCPIISRYQLKIMYDPPAGQVYVQNLSKSVKLCLENTESLLAYMDIGILHEGERFCFPRLDQEAGFRIEKVYRHETIVDIEDKPTAEQQEKFTVSLKPDLLGMQ